MTVRPEAKDVPATEAAAGTRIYRHAVLVRLTHWVNVLCMTILLMSGLQIFNAHPALYWGNKSTFAAPLLAMGAEQDAKGKAVGITNVLGHNFTTTGVLGLSSDGQGGMTERGFPDWATIPSTQWLAMGRRWHFFFAWLFVANAAIYLAYGLLRRHFWRDFLPARGDFGHIGRSIWDHLRLRFPKGEAAKRYNVLQRLTYLVVVFVLAPVMVLAGLAMSPRLDAGYPILLDLFGGRQSARTIHFLCAFTFLAFVIIHVLMVVLSGPWNNLRSMITGRYDIGRAEGEEDRG